MSAAIEQRSALEQSLMATLKRVSAKAESGWLGKLRSEAGSRVLQSGMPNSKAEAWRFVPMQTLLNASFDSLREKDAGLAGVHPRSESGLLCLNGIFQVNEAQQETGLKITTLRDASVHDKEALAFFLGRVAKKGDAWFDANTALCPDVLWIRVQKGAVLKTPLDLEHMVSSRNGNSLVQSRVLLTLEENSECTFVEHFASAQSKAATSEALCLNNIVVETVLGAGARLKHFRVFAGSGQDHQLYQNHARIERDAQLHSAAFSLRGAFRREQTFISLCGEGAHCELEGAFVTAGEEFSGHYTTLDHESPHTTSAQRFRGVLSEKSRGVFDGGIKVRRDAQKVSATQENHNLLLSDTAIVHTKPQLQIDADDVKCSHGATVGQLDPNQMFYLRSRGMDEQHAKALLTYAFVRELTHAARGLPIYPELQELLLERLGAEEFSEEFC